MKFTVDDDLLYAIDHCIDGLQHTYLNFPKPATEADTRECIKQAKICIGSLMTEVKKAENRLDGKVDLVNIYDSVFNNQKVRSEA